MEQVIYADTYFIINFSMDFLVLWLTAKLLHLPMRTWRAALAAALGGIYAPLSLLLARYPIVELLCSVAVPALICYTAFKACSPLRFIQRFAVFFGTSLLLGGAMSALGSMLRGLLGGRQVSVGGVVKELPYEVPLWVFALLALICAAISLIWGRLAGHLRAGGSAKLGICVEREGRLCELSALVDSGNLLVEPLGGLPVVLLCSDAAERILPPQIGKLLCCSPTSECITSRRMRLVPYRSVGGSGVMLGYIPDYLSVAGREVVACICVDRSGRDFSGFDAIVPSII